MGLTKLHIPVDKWLFSQSGNGEISSIHIRVQLQSLTSNCNKNSQFLNLPPRPIIQDTTLLWDCSNIRCVLLPGLIIIQPCMAYLPLQHRSLITCHSKALSTHLMLNHQALITHNDSGLSL